MPKFPDDMEKARAKTAKDAARHAAEQQRRLEAERRDEATVREFANELRRKVGAPELKPDEPVQGFFCSRGRKR